MNRTRNLAALLTLVTLLGTASLFADNRHRETTNGRYGHGQHARRVTVEGRIHDIDRERNGFVIRLDRGRQMLIADGRTPVERVSNRRNHRTHVRQLERGDTIRATGTVNARGYVYVERISLLREEDDRRDRDDTYLRGRVQSVDRGGVVWVEEERSGRVIAVDTRRVDRNDRRYDVDDLRRGDRITVRGDWRRDGRFEAERVEVDRGAWW